jgi:TolB-like protein
LPAESGRVRLAVMPFDNLRPDPANAFFAYGKHEQILSALATSARLIDLVSRTTMISYRRRAASVFTLRKANCCTHLLERTVWREDHAARLTVQLIDARTDQRQ